MFKEYDVVLASHKLSSTVYSGTVGTILMTYPGITGIYGVEFLDSNGKTLEILTVCDDDIAAQHSNSI